MGIVMMKTEGTIGKDGIVRTQTTGMGAVGENTLVWPKGAVMAEGLRWIELEKKLKEARSQNLNVFSPKCNPHCLFPRESRGEAGCGFAGQNGLADQKLRRL